MSLLQSYRSLVVAGILGVAFAGLVHLAVGWEEPATAPAAGETPAGLTIEVDSDVPGAAFALVSTEIVATGSRPFTTPFRWEFGGRELNLAVLGLDPEVPLRLRINGNEVPQPPVDGPSGVDKVSSEGFDPRSVAVVGVSGKISRAFQAVSPGQLDGILAVLGGPYPGVQFGSGLLCTGPEVWDLAVAGQVAEARDRCMESRRIRGLTDGG